MATRLMMLLVLTMAIVVVAGGCGADDSDSSSGKGITSSSLSKAEFVKQANKACEAQRAGLVERIETYLRQHNDDGKPSPVLYADMTKAVWLPTIEAESEAVRALGAPEGEEEQVEAFLAAQQAAVDEAAGLKKVPSLETVEGHFVRATKQISAYGLTSCINSPAPEG